MNSGNHLVDPNGSIHAQTPHHCGRRDFVKSVAALAGAAGLSAYDMRLAAAEPPPEVKKIRVTVIPGPGIGLCMVPLYLGDELLRLEGCSDVQYVPYSVRRRTQQKTPGRNADRR